jgi:hypothetical protein
MINTLQVVISETYLIQIKTNKYNNKEKQMSLKVDPIYRRWSWIIQAKFNPNCPDYYYGHKLKLGFKNFPEFEEYVSQLPKPTEKHKFLHRINQEEGWIKGNLTWATGRQAGNNHKHCEFIQYQGETKSLKDWARAYGMSYWTFLNRYNRGMTMKEIFNIPNKKTGKTYARIQEV